MSGLRSNSQSVFHPETVSDGTIHRLSLYARLLAALEAEGIPVVSSGELSNRVHYSKRRFSPASAG